MSDTHKSAELERIAIEHGWKTQVKPEFPADFDDNPLANRIEWHFFAVRGNETLHVVYRGDRMLENNVYTFGDYRRYPQRRVAVVGFLTGTPDLSKSAAVLDPVALIEARSVDWDEETPAMEIMLEVINKEVRYVNRLSNEVESKVVRVNLKEPLSSKLFRVYHAPSGRRILEWADSFGFHCIALEQIVSVS